jgi:fructokinase
MTAIGIDLGGTKTEIIAMAEDGHELFRQRRATPRQYEATLDLIVGLVAEAEQAAGHASNRTASVGLGIPGTLSPVNHCVKNANSTWLIGHPIDRDLGSRLGRPVTVMNDANCFALSEAVDGAGAGFGVVFGVILGTGVGGGIVVDGRILEGAQRIAGEWGHNPLPVQGDERAPSNPCYCGRRGCIETFLSGPGMERDHRANGGSECGTREIVRAARHGDPIAAATLGRYVDRLARSLALVINILDPDVIVLGGGMSNLPDLASLAERTVGQYLFTDEPLTPIRQNRHGDASGVRGAAWLGAAGSGAQSPGAS